ncbi:hypothetical protein G7Z17_g12989 [Cylindrodendrum hubeiense]|uniref:Uncharacterized protein n=1 Tax=Cylindrodendrum hubeiense TaxID=595255 RepID=A0A9P5H1X2_9HYPO|nr:hypothetical protein G7Z17_g12989 [Cylindrodendrum hubeiense]
MAAVPPAREPAAQYPGLPGAGKVSEDETDSEILAGESAAPTRRDLPAAEGVDGREEENYIEEYSEWQISQAHSRVCVIA